MDLAREFPGLEKSTYLNSCSHGLLPQRTRRALEAHLQVWEDLPDWGAWTQEQEKARAAFAKLIHAKPEDIALVANASQGIGAVMSALSPRGARNVILTTDIDFPTDPTLARAQASRGFQHKHVAWPTYQKELAGGDVALACAPYVASFSGRRLPIKALAAEAHAHGAPLLVDAFQACGNVDIDVRRDDVDFLVAGVYKWLMAPAGLAFLYVRPDHAALQPTAVGWHALADPYSFDPLSAFAPDARRYQSGGASIIGCVGASTSIGMLLEYGVASVEKRNAGLVERILQHADERKLDVLTPHARDERASIITFRVPDQEKALAACARENVIINPRLGGLRVSPHFYNKEADVDRLFDVLDQAALS